MQVAADGVEYDVDQRLCTGKKPATIESCNTMDCQPEWVSQPFGAVRYVIDILHSINEMKNNYYGIEFVQIANGYRNSNPLQFIQSCPISKRAVLCVSLKSMFLRVPLS